MISLIDYFYLFIYGALLLLGLVGLWFTAVMPAIESWSRRFFRLYYMVLIMCMIFGISFCRHSLYLLMKLNLILP